MCAYCVWSGLSFEIRIMRWGNSHERKREFGTKIRWEWEWKRVAFGLTGMETDMGPTLQDWDSRTHFYTPLTQRLQLWRSRKRVYQNSRQDLGSPRKDRNTHDFLLTEPIWRSLKVGLFKVANDKCFEMNDFFSDCTFIVAPGYRVNMKSQIKLNH